MLLRAKPMADHARSAFTLVELVLVIVIIGILAAIAMPRLSRGSAGASAASTDRDLAILRRQIDLYAIEHGGVYPGRNGDGSNGPHTAESFLNQMNAYTSLQGRFATSRTSTCWLGPYLEVMPELKVGPKAGLNGVLVVTGNTALQYRADEEVGWLYNDTSGEIAANAPEHYGPGNGAEPEAVPGGPEALP